MAKRIQFVGIVLALIGLGFMVGGGIAYAQVQNGYDALQSFSEAQNVTLAYTEDGQLIDRGTTEGAEAIMNLLVDDWGYAVDESELDPNDPLVNTDTEYMYQMATIAYHTLHGTQTVVLEEDVEYEGEVFPAGTYESTSTAAIGPTSIGCTPSRALLVARHGRGRHTVSSVSSAWAR